MLKGRAETDIIAIDDCHVRPIGEVCDKTSGLMNETNNDFLNAELCFKFYEN